IDLRPGTERAHAPDLHVVAALVLSGDHALDRDPVRERLLQLTGDVSAAAGDPLQRDRSRARAIVDDRRLDLVALAELNRTGRRIAELGEVDRRLGLVADRDERRRGADRDHGAADDVAGGDPALARLRALARGEESGEILFVLVGHARLAANSTPSDVVVHPETCASPGSGGAFLMARY